MIHADLFATIADPPQRVSPPPSDRYIARFHRKWPMAGDVIVQAPIADDYAEMPWAMRRFVDGICAPAPYSRVKHAGRMEDNDDG